MLSQYPCLQKRKVLLFDLTSSSQKLSEEWRYVKEFTFLVFKCNDGLRIVDPLNGTDVSTARLLARLEVYF